MPIAINTGTKNVPLKFARQLSKLVNDSWESGEFLEKTTSVTQDLLRFWFSESFTSSRHINFHVGQRQAILNSIYIHEIIGNTSVFEMYSNVDDELLAELDLVELQAYKYSHPKYCIKMATGTGKTWVMHALLLWQFLNAKQEEQSSGRYSKNFLLVAPGLIVYERLLDAFLGKENEDRIREFNNSDIKQFEGLFIPPSYKETVFGFIQSNVVQKSEIGKKVTGDGLIAITNWHLLAGVDENEEIEISPLEDPSKAVKEILPITPGTTAGHTLDSLDNAYLRGGEIEYLTKLDDLVVFNDEAHHIHTIKHYGEIKEVEWQKSLNKISEPKEHNFIQIDFSATPYDVTGSGQNRTKHYFPHIVVDFDLKTAIHNGLVKTIALDKRKEIATTELDFKAERDGRRVISLSDGQKLMIRAGLRKLNILEEQFVELTKDKDDISTKHPKMLIMCEDTNVSPFIVDFLTTSEGLTDEDVAQIDSGRKEYLSDKQWNDAKQKLFNIDKYQRPRVIVSVLMLREGFDVNNICVIVPLRSSEAPILLEQTIGRGLRLMWREPEYQESKDENRNKLLKKKEEPDNYLDILSIVEHPAFMQFYEDLLKEGLVGETEDLPDGKTGVLGDIIKVGLRADYKKYDLYWPIILRDKEEDLIPTELSVDNLQPIDWYSLDQLIKMVPKGGESFFSEEITVKTRFGDYKVTADLFNAKSYNDFLAKLVAAITKALGKVGSRRIREFPVMQVNIVALAKMLDQFIRTKLFKQEFNPMEGNNWRVLLLSQTGIVEHIVKEASKAIYELQSNIDVSEAVIIKKYFSEVDTLKMRERYSIEVAKCIYERINYPSNKGELERQFIEFADTDTGVTAFLRINEYYHQFAHINYIRTDGILASYYPDFIVKTADKIYLVETKAQKDLKDRNVIQKELGALDWLKRTNELIPSDRMDAAWEYVLLGHNTFYSLREKGASISEMMELSKLTMEKTKGTLF